MRTDSTVLRLVGLGALLGAVWIAWTQTVLPRYVPPGVALGGILLLVAAAAFRLAGRLDAETRTVVVRKRPSTRVVGEEE